MPKILVTGARRSGKSRLIQALCSLQPDLPRVRLSPEVDGALGIPRGCVRYTSEERRVLPEATETSEHWIAELDPPPEAIDYSEFEQKYGVLVICCVSSHVELRIKEELPGFKRNENYPMMVEIPESDAQLEVSALNILAWLKQGVERKLAFFNAFVKEWLIRDPEIEIHEAGWSEEEEGTLKVHITTKQDNGGAVIESVYIDMVNRPLYPHRWLI